jgi:hypothetical protein
MAIVAWPGSEGPKVQLLAISGNAASRVCGTVT